MRHHLGDGGESGIDQTLNIIRFYGHGLLLNCCTRALCQAVFELHGRTQRGLTEVCQMESVFH